MKLISRLVLPSLLCLTILPTTAQAIDYDQNSEYMRKIDYGVGSLLKYFVNFSAYLGYDVTQPATQNNNTLSSKLLNAAAIQVTQNYVFNTVLGAVPVNAFSQAFSQFVPNNFPVYSPINAFANYTFSSQSYSSPQGQQGQVSVSPLIDQQNYQQDPVNQAVLNILATPDFSYCMNYDGSTWKKNCNLLYQNKVMLNVLGKLPSTYDYFTYNYNQQFLSQLNSNTLISPLLYSTESGTASTSSSPEGQGENKGLTAQNQAQQAANFIRYAAGEVSPAPLPNLKEYDTIYSTATSTDPSISEEKRKEAQATLSNYFTKLRTYAARSSVGISNLYYIMSKRLPQNQSADGSNRTSQALSEFTMATWRLYNPDQSANKQWLNQINQASPATVQKEIAILLSEINYQLYLTRQQQERLLLTNTMLLIQNNRGAQPETSFTTEPTSGDE